MISNAKIKADKRYGKKQYQDDEQFEMDVNIQKIQEFVVLKH